MTDEPVDLGALRAEYMSAGLDETRVAPDPFVQFDEWLAAIVAAGLHQPDAMVLATATPDGMPAARMVLFKGAGSEGFRFFTNLESSKALDLAANPRAALVFPWHAVQRQVRVTGTVVALADSASDAYFASRPRGAQVSAWVSPQSSVIAGRTMLEKAAAELESTRFAEGPIPRPPFWGGYCVQPETFEFWQGRPDRLHDRVRYRRADGQWLRERLAP